MKKIGFVGVAEAVIVSGEVTVAPSVRPEIVSGKSFDPAGGGTCAAGAGNGLLEGVHVIGCGGANGRPGGLDAVEVEVVEFDPQPDRSVQKARSNMVKKTLIKIAFKKDWKMCGFKRDE
jgi:hypothetical protein